VWKNIYKEKKKEKERKRKRKGEKRFQPLHEKNIYELYKWN
jgi:hypothetical protein